jgi:hypothetical protein
MWVEGRWVEGRYQNKKAVTKKKGLSRYSTVAVGFDQSKTQYTHFELAPK